MNVPIDTLLAESFDKFLAGCCPPAAVREVERSHQAAALWAEVESSGYLDLLVAEAAGGAGLGLRDAFPILLACGRQALPVPLAATMWLRGALAKAGLAAPHGPLTIASQCSFAADGSIRCQGVPFGTLADWVLVADGSAGLLLPVAQGERRVTGVHGSLQAHLSWRSTPADTREAADAFVRADGRRAAHRHADGRRDAEGARQPRSPTPTTARSSARPSASSRRCSSSSA